VTASKQSQSRQQATEVPATIDVIETQLAVLVRLLDNLSRTAYTYRDLDRASYLMARALESAAPVSIQGLAKILHLEPGTVTRKIASMEAAGLIVRLSDPTDKRISLVKLSREGVRSMRVVRDLRRAHNNTMLSRWSDEELKTFGELLTRYNECLGSQPDDLRGADVPLR
jgi:DNA-binding MarR family transcriptional regulator